MYLVMKYFSVNSFGKTYVIKPTRETEKCYFLDSTNGHYARYRKSECNRVQFLADNINRVIATGKTKEDAMNNAMNFIIDFLKSQIKLVEKSFS